MNVEQEILNAFERGKAFGFAEGMKSMRPVNSVLVPCDKLAEMQAEIDALKKEAALQRLSDFTQEDEIEALKAKAHEWYLIAMGKAQEK